VPLPIAIDDHQTANARVLTRAGGGWLIPQPHFTPDTLAAQLAELFSAPHALARAAAASASQGAQDAAARLAEFVESRITAEAPA
jgi:UDP-N-acetylglucosamine--N-acetylmuramyl-(pentapeptide) pyrophosphoryl-undecaprenol N-acetylglucosamine transferase